MDIKKISHSKLIKIGGLCIAAIVAIYNEAKEQKKDDVIEELTKRVETLEKK